MKKFEGNLVDRCCEVYGLSLLEFARKYNLAESTLKQWRDPDKLPSYGKLLLKVMIENYELQEKAEKLDRLIGIANESGT